MSFFSLILLGSILIVVGFVAWCVGFISGATQARNVERERTRKNFATSLCAALLEGANQSFKEGRTCIVIAVPFPLAEQIKREFMPMYSPMLPSGPLYMHNDAFARLHTVTRKRTATASSQDLN